MQISCSFNIVDNSLTGPTIMRALSSFLHRLIGPAEEDHLTGAVDLSDSAYCFELLARNCVDAGAQFFPQCIDTAAGINSAHQAS
jgi:hypothetical protein